jgi:hypothetical protein
MNDCQMEIPNGMQILDHSGVGLHIQTRRFLWCPRYLPVIDTHGLWDGRRYSFRWLCWATMRGYEQSGFYAFVKD